MARLTLDQIARETKSSGGAATFSADTALALSHRALSDVSCLSDFKNLERLDLSCNCLSTLEGLSSCINLKWLSVVENKLESLKGIEGLSKLTVLNAGKNKLRTMDEVRSATSLRAIILNDNNISSICKLDELKYLNTLVLSRNPILDIGDSLRMVKTMTKLSLSHCEIQNIGSSLVSCADLKEVRLAYNKITTIPAELARNVKLRNLDLGNNLIENWSDLKVLSALKNLRNLNLLGNPIAEKDNLAKKVKNLVPKLRIFNAKPIEKSSGSEKISVENKTSDEKEDPSPRSTAKIDVPKEVREKDSKLDTKSSTKLAKENASEEANEIQAVSVTKEKNLKSSKNAKIEDSTQVKEIKDKKRKNPVDKEQNEFEGIDDPETPFADLIFSDIQDSDPKQKHQEAVSNGESVDWLVVDHVKKKNKKGKDKSVNVGPPALNFLSAVSEVGMGGPSTWD
ncbi:Protein phosphatase 1 regulatory subunit 7 [Ananas comosus]|uniref:Protein phosphatase 1 regulatory subunit 7 n=1 Tax=Ananas comosus TaxID=4615 RepID=A0A199UTG6_ANACO|nr:Protein phosphatase 1 regulatory subunit 7 [Ananas comosus]